MKKEAAVFFSFLLLTIALLFRLTSSNFVPKAESGPVVKRLLPSGLLAPSARKKEK